ncbi:hypothetical protein KGF56_003036 [Candida oxycetoniae]|uniref:Uncharacterized protein n=1 Tax=Candida oxycetoniae TaxID=497107 RepID=A0AAI9SW16_9ASCO|nr:uncharacterized protein KGF56_003036 [Candida oxycetoniae]KAI3404136.2 hypothetical protein KGF56_003036 [Candida oxycetoniae]
MDLPTLSLLTVVGIYVFLKLLSQLCTVPKEYLQQQSSVEPTRLAHESSIYKSIRYHSLRVGLDIRYDSYKIRSGNLNDIWSIAMAEAAQKRDKGIFINREVLKYTYINYCISEWQKKQEEPIESINIPIDYTIDKKWVVGVLIGFILQIPVRFYERNKGKDKDKDKDKLSSGLDISNITLPTKEKEKLDFVNNYTPTKDRGIAIKYARQVRPGIDVLVEFTQLNLVSAVASSIKHLPVDYSGKSMTIVPSESFENISNSIVKLLMGFVSNMEIHIDYEARFDTDMISLPDYVVDKNKLNKMSFISKLKLFALNKGIFKSTKLIYIQSNLDKPKFTSIEKNKLMISKNSHVIQEFHNFNVIGPILVTDYFEHRTYAPYFGAISQSLEMKLINFDPRTKSGNIMIRGYSIGKPTNFINGKVAENDMHGNQYKKSSDGFMPLPLNIKGRWGTDGCLYIV